MFSFDFEEQADKAGRPTSSTTSSYFSEDDEYSTDDEALKNSQFGSVTSFGAAAGGSHLNQNPMNNGGSLSAAGAQLPASRSFQHIYHINNVDLVSGHSSAEPIVLFGQSSLGTIQENVAASTTAMQGIISPGVKISKTDFQLLRVIGKGAYGKVFLVKKITGSDSETYYAMKVLKKASLVIHAKDAEHTKTERSILEDVRHPFIVRLFYAFQTDFKLYLILDYASGGELFMYLEKQKMFLEDTAVFYISELVLAIEHLHSYGIIYRDLKPENVLLDHDGHVKLTDFGLSKVALNDEDKTNTVCGTIEYMAPEIIANMEYDKVVDWWSLGALSYDMMTGSPPFTSNNRKKTMDLIMNKKLSLPYFLSPDAKDLLTKLMRKSPLVRLGYDSANSLKQHRFFKSIDWKQLINREVVPPITPQINSPEDVDNFHSAFTSMPVVDSPADGIQDDVFTGFSFVASCVLDSQLDNFHSRTIHPPNRPTSTSTANSHPTTSPTATSNPLHMKQP